MGSETPMTDALNERHAEEWNSSGRSVGEQYAEMRDHARRLEFALTVAEGALRRRCSDDSATDMAGIAIAREALRAIAQIKGGV